MKEYDIIITETLQMTVSIEADNKEDALKIAEKNWRKAEYILDSSNFKDVKFMTERANKERYR